MAEPQHLAELEQLRADVRLTCLRCGYEDDWAPAALAAHVRELGGTTAWAQLTRVLVCRKAGCGSSDLEATAVPYVRRTANLPRRVSPFDQHVIATALAILSDAAARSGGQAVAGLDVRLSLLVLHRYVGDRTLLKAFWAGASAGKRNVSEGRQQPLHSLRKRLELRGWLAPDVPLRDVPYWPWNTPAPPGWRSASRAAQRDGDTD